MNAPGPTTRLEVQRYVNEVCDRFEAAWQRGERPSLDSALAAAPEAMRATLQGELLLLEEEYRNKPIRTAAEQPKRLAHFRIEGVLGEGGMGTVYLAEDTLLGRKVALKTLRGELTRDPCARERFLREARLASRLEHESIVVIYSVGEAEGIPFLAMPVLHGESLRDTLARDTAPMQVARAVRIARAIATGLAAAHEQGLVHRDIKPGNIWLESPGERVKILDFGLARLAGGDSTVTASGIVVGTPAYMAPEQARGLPVDHRADLFSLGCLLYQLVTLRRPFAGADPLAVLSSLALDTPAPPHTLNPLCPLKLSELIGQLMHKQPDTRPASAQLVVQALDDIVGTTSEANPEPISPVAPAPRSSAESDSTAILEPPTLRPRRRRRLPWLVVLVIVGGIVYHFASQRGEVADGDRTLAALPPPEVPLPNDPDHRAAAWVLSVGGTVRVDEQPQDIRELGALPKQRFRLTSVTLQYSPQTTASGLEHFRGCRHLVELDLLGSQVSDPGLLHFKSCSNLSRLNLQGTWVGDEGLAAFRDCKKLTCLILHNTRTGDAGLANFKDCKNLQALDLYATGVTDAGLAHLKECRKLTDLNLQHLDVSDAGLTHFKGSTNLLRLSVNSARVGDVGLEAFKESKNVIGLGLDGTRVSDVTLAHFKDSQHLTDLRLSATQVTDAGLTLFKGRVNLIALDLGSTRVTTAGLAHFKDCKSLRYLTLNFTQIDDVGLAHFKDCNELLQLQLNGTQVSDAGLAPLKNFEKLRELALCCPQVSDDGLVHLRNCRDLASLYLNGARVSNRGLTHLAVCKNLNRLELRKAQVNDEGLRTLEALRQLMTLELRDTKVSAAGIDRLRKALPACTIYWDGGTLPPLRR